MLSDDYDGSFPQELSLEERIACKLFTFKGDDWGTGIERLYVKDSSIAKVVATRHGVSFDGKFSFDRSHLFELVERLQKRLETRSMKLDIDE